MKKNKDIGWEKKDNNVGSDGNYDDTLYATKEYVDDEIRKIELIPGEQGEKGEKGEKGTDGLTTSILVNGQTFTHENGVITLPDYPQASVPIDTYSKEEIDDIIEDYTGEKKQRYVTQEEYDNLTENEKNDDSIVWNITDTEEYAIPADLSFDDNTLFLQDKDGNNIGEGVSLERSSASVVFLTSPNGTLYELVVSDSGELSAVEHKGV